MYKNYDYECIETAAQKYWDKNSCFVSVEDLTKEKFYCLSMLPYPSGQIHMGHVRNYAIGDLVARYQRMLGKNVLQPFGWDAFGLPAENAALEYKLPPSTWTYKNIAQMREVIKRLGFAIDWSREFATCQPDYYRWEQWLFLRMYQKGLVYKKKSVVNWDPVDQTVLANEQVVNGRGWRSGALVERREISQWFLRITAYADELLECLQQLEGWPEPVCTMQNNWIGRSEGLEITFKIANNQREIKVFTTRPDTLMGVTYLAIAPAHPIAIAAAAQNPAVAAFIAKCQNIKAAEAELATLPKEGIYAGINAIHPVTGEEIPLWIANFVLMEYGSGAVMSVPAHDQRDFEFAKQYGLKIKQVIKPADNSYWDFSAGAFVAKGVLMNSGIFDYMPSQRAFTVIAEHLAKQGLAEKKINYRLRDWGVSRQRYWGAPIPMLHCAKCGTVPVSEDDLPVLLPENITLTDPRSPLATLDSFVKTVCTVCGGEARRETDTFDTFVESSWYYARYCCPGQNESMLDQRVNYWMPVDQYIGGIEHAVMHLLYARFIYKVMRDEGLVNHDEPFTNLLTQGMVLKDGSKMSKSKGNVVSPVDMIAKYGADTARLFIIFAAPPEQSLEWSDSGIEGAYKFLKKIYNFALQYYDYFVDIDKYCADAGNAEAVREKRRIIHLILQQANNDIHKLQFNTVVSACMKLFNSLQELTDNIEQNIQVIHEGFSILLRLLAPIAPHITHYLWQELRFAADGSDIIDAKWPEVDQQILISSETQIVVQINGKVRATLVVPTDSSEEMVKKLALEHQNVQKFLDGKSVKKIIVIQNRLVSIVVV